MDKDGNRVYAKNYGLRGWPLVVPRLLELALEDTFIHPLETPAPEKFFRPHRVVVLGPRPRFGFRISEQAPLFRCGLTMQAYDSSRYGRSQVPQVLAPNGRSK